MNLTVPTNWQKELITGLAKLNTNGQVKEIYGKLALDEVGGGRPPSALAYVSKKQAKAHIKKIKESGFEFNYLLNSLCFDNLEFTKKGQKMFRRLLDWISENEVDRVTVANPFLLMWIKENYPQLKITVSAMANINTVKKAKQWETLGADKITFPASAVNRNLKLIKLLRESLSSKIQLIANSGCLLNCPDLSNHALMNSHVSQKWHKCKGYILDYHILNCRYKRLAEPVNFIRSEWIRPEDIPFYKNLGVDTIKLIDRRLSTEKILQITEAYLKQNYEGNLIDLLPIFQGRSFNIHKKRVRKIFFLGNIFSMNIFKILKYSKLFSKIDIKIDNKALNGFIEKIPERCSPDLCPTCKLCLQTADRVVQIDPNYQEQLKTQYKEALDEILKKGLSFF